MQYLEGDHYPKSLLNRPNRVIPKEFINGHEVISQEKMSEVLSSSRAPPKWVKDFVLNELKPLFMRSRHLDNCKKNLIIQEFLTVLFPKYSTDNREKLVALATDFRKSWSNWRNILWNKIITRYDRFCKHLKDNEDASPKSYLKERHITDIFGTWIKYVTEMSKENDDALKNLTIFAFHCIAKHPKDAQSRFFSSTGNLYTINCNFPSTYNIATSLDLSQYDISLGNQKTIDSDSSTDEEGSKKRLKHKRKSS